MNDRTAVNNVFLVYYRNETFRLLVILLRHINKLWKLVVPLVTFL